MIKLVIFDLDGTLLNTLEDLADSCNYLLRKYGFPEHPLDSYRYFVGNGIRKLVERILPETHRQDAFIESFFQEMVAYYDLHKEDKTKPYNGMVETLEALQERGVMLGVASNKVDKAMAPLMAHYFPTIKFTAVFGQREGIPVKPDPQIVFDILEIAGVGTEEALYVGDTGVDMDTAHGAGLKAVGALWGYRDRQELIDHKADCIIERPEELVELKTEN